MKTYKGLNLPVKTSFYYHDVHMVSDVYEVFTLSDEGGKVRMGTVDKILTGRNAGKWVAQAFSLTAGFPTLRVAAKEVLREYGKQAENEFPGALWK